MKNYWIVKLNSILVALLTICAASAQLSSESYKGLPNWENKAEAQQYYLFPITPGLDASLSGTMGEIRGDHFHSGIDIRTNNRIDIPTQAAQQGYVSRIKISPTGYGNTLYLRHPNGEITVYAHLNRFIDPLAEYVKKEQYRKKSFAVNLFPEPNRFHVHRGDTIAYSGNSGSSNGPHLHFEVRTAQNEPLNPLKFNFEEILDNKPPEISKIILQTIGINSRINGRFGRIEFNTVKEKAHYTLPDTIYAKGRIGIEFLGYDKLNDTIFECGINSIEMRAGEQIIFSQKIDTIHFYNTRNVQTVIDYPTFQSQGKYAKKLYLDDGNRLNYYSHIVEKGIVRVEKQNIPIKITFQDAYGNQSKVNFRIRPEPLTRNTPTLKQEEYYPYYEVLKNTLVLKSKKEWGNEAKLFYKNRSVIVVPAYFDAYQNVFLIDIRNRLPDAALIGDENIVFDFKKIISPSIKSTYEDDKVKLRFSSKTLYDTVFLRTNYTYKEKEIFSIGDPSYPLKRRMKITLKPKNYYPESASVYRIKDGHMQYIGGTWQQGYISFSSLSFGNYTILSDSLPPVITPLTVDKKEARFSIKDNLSGINSYEGNLNGEWLLLNYDPKNAMIWGEPLNTSIPLKGELVIKIADNAGNETTYQHTIR